VSGTLVAKCVVEILRSVFIFNYKIKTTQPNFYLVNYIIVIFYFKKKEKLNIFLDFENLLYFCTTKKNGLLSNDKTINWTFGRLLVSLLIKYFCLQILLFFAMSKNNDREKTRYTEKELSEFEAIIDKKLEEAKKQLNYYLKQMSDRADNPDSKIKGLDDGIGTAESERLNSMAARSRKHVQHLENAKLRIQNKVYGICRESGKLISKQRLYAVPHATLSIEAKQRR